MALTKTNRDILTLLQAIDAKQDAQMEKISAVHTRQEVSQVTLDYVKVLSEKTNGRVSKLENWRNYLTGGLTVVSAGVSFIITKMIGK